jgi:hypothetical protein
MSLPLTHTLFKFVLTNIPPGKFSQLQTSVTKILLLITVLENKRNCARVMHAVAGVDKNDDYTTFVVVII